jgi:hypothetical protein
MRKDLVDILACPICKSPLELTVEEESGEEVIRGHLTCNRDEDCLMEGSQRLGVIIMLASVLEMVVFVWAVSRRSYLAVALPITLILGALNALAFWIGWTMFTATEEEEEELEAALQDIPSASPQP